MKAEIWDFGLSENWGREKMKIISPKSFFTIFFCFSIETMMEKIESSYGENSV